MHSLVIFKISINIDVSESPFVDRDDDCVLWFGFIVYYFAISVLNLLNSLSPIAPMLELKKKFIVCNLPI